MDAREPSGDDERPPAPPFARHVLRGYALGILAGILYTFAWIASDTAQRMGLAGSTAPFRDWWAVHGRDLWSIPISYPFVFVYFLPAIPLILSLAERTAARHWWVFALGGALVATVFLSGIVFLMPEMPWFAARTGSESRTGHPLFSDAIQVVALAGAFAGATFWWVSIRRRQA